MTVTDIQGMILAWHRWYNPQALRWLNRDPISYDGGDNTYAYVGGNPVRFVDPSGLAPFENNSDTPVRIKPEDGPAWPPTYCMPGTPCDVDGYYGFDGACPGGDVSGGEKIPNNCSGAVNEDGTVSTNCRKVSLREICKYKHWGRCPFYPTYPILNNPTSPVTPLLSDPTWSPYGPGDPRRPK